MSAALDHCAARCSDDPAFFGHALRRFATARLWTNAQLAAWLGCDAGTLTRLRLCGNLQSEADVRAVAESFGVAAEKVREVAFG